MARALLPPVLVARRAIRATVQTMDVNAAHELLGTTPTMTAAERRAAYHKQRHALEDHLVETTVPLLKERYRIAIARLDEAFAAVVIAGASEEIPVLRGLGHAGAGPLPAPGLSASKQPSSTAGIWRDLPYAGPHAGSVGAVPGAAAAADTPMEHPGPNLPIHPPTSSGSIWRDLPSAESGHAAEAAHGAGPAPGSAPGSDRQAVTPPSVDPVSPPSASTTTPSRGAQVLTPTHAHVRVQSRTPTQGVPIIPGDTARPRSSGKIPVPAFRARPAPRLLPWFLMMLLVGAVIAAVTWRLLAH